MDYQDRTLRCRDCGEDFIWKSGEQAFFDQKGFSPPTRCPGCRQKKKAGRLVGDLQTSKHKITCSLCGKVGEVPFQPRNPEGILCAECFEKSRMTHR